MSTKTYFYRLVDVGFGARSLFLSTLFEPDSIVSLICINECAAVSNLVRASSPGSEIAPTHTRVPAVPGYVSGLFPIGHAVLGIITGIILVETTLEPERPLSERQKESGTGILGYQSLEYLPLRGTSWQCYTQRIRRDGRRMQVDPNPCYETQEMQRVECSFDMSLGITQKHGRRGTTGPLIRTVS